MQHGLGKLTHTDGGATEGGDGMYDHGQGTYAEGKLSKKWNDGYHFL